MKTDLAALGVPNRSTGAEIEVERLFEVTYLAPRTHGRTILILQHGTVSTGIKSNARAAGVYDLTEKGTALKISFVLLLGGRRPGADASGEKAGGNRLTPIMVRIVVPLDAMDRTFTTDTSAGRVRLRMRRIWDYPKETGFGSDSGTDTPPDPVPAE